MYVYVTFIMYYVYYAIFTVLYVYYVYMYSMCVHVHVHVCVCVMCCLLFLQCSGRTVCIFLLSTYTDGLPPDSTAWFCQWVADTAADFRVHKSLLRGLHFTVFALGNSLYVQHYNTAGRELYRSLQQLAATPVYHLGLGDQNVAQSKYGGKYVVCTYVYTCMYVYIYCTYIGEGYFC